MAARATATRGQTMTQDFRPFRSVLYMPGSRPRTIEKARGLAADALILDLEDAVAPAEKESARETVAAAVGAGGFGERTVLVRVNALDTAWGVADVERIAGAGADAILLPKVETGEQIARLADLMTRHGARERTRVWAMLETPRAFLAAQAVASAHPRLGGLVMGMNDLIKDLRAADVPGRAPLVAALGLGLLAARANGLVCVDGVYNAFRDAEGLRAECEQGRDMGFDGKSLIHPDQIAVANEVFAPSKAAVIHAAAQVEAHEAAQARGEGVAVLDGRIVENLHVETARQTLARAEAIAKRAGAVMDKEGSGR